MIALRQHILSKYLNSTILQVFCLIIETNDIKRLIFDIWSILWCIEEHRVNNEVFDALDYVFLKKTYVICVCKVCLMPHFDILNSDNYEAFSSIFPDLCTYDRDYYREWLWDIYLQIQMGMLDRLEMGELLYKSDCSGKFNLPKDNMFEICLKPYYKVAFHSKIKRQQAIFEEHVLKRRKLQ